MKPIFLVDGKKKCSKCGIEKVADAFHKASHKPSGLSSQCKECRNKIIAEYAKRNPENGKARSKKWRDINAAKAKEQSDVWCKANPEKCKAKAKRYYENHKEEILKVARVRVREWYWENKEKALAASKKWADNNRERVNEQNRKYNRKFRSTAKGKLTSIISNRIRESLQKGMKAGHHWETLVNFTVDQLKEHLERQFDSNMTWENYGSYWHIDHIIPIAAFNFETPEDIDFKRCWALKNLQPLEKIENMRKGAKIDRPFQQSLALAI